MLLVLTTSTDVTADLLFERFDHSAFRLNYDLWQDYAVILQPDRWEITNPTGFKITSESATHAFWWKSFQAKLEKADPYLVAEIKYIFRELYGSFQHRVVGSSPDFHDSLGKVQLLKIASRYFRTPPASIVGWNLPAQIEEFQRGIVAKSLSSEPTGDTRLLYTSTVEYQKIDRAFPWFLQAKVDASYDVTVVVCGRAFFAFARSRTGLAGLDWRRCIADEDPENPSWHVRALSDDEHAGLRGLCQELGVTWGRFDFLQNENLVFLEFNANGQWAWLDLRGQHGLFDAVVTYLLTPPAEGNNATNLFPNSNSRGDVHKCRGSRRE